MVSGDLEVHSRWHWSCNFIDYYWIHSLENWNNSHVSTILRLLYLLQENLNLHTHLFN